MNVRTSLIILLCFTAGLLTAQVVNKDYLVKPGDGFTLYFIMPVDGFKTRDSKQSDELELDMTFKTNEDSVTINMSFLTKQTFTVDSVAFIRADSTVFTALYPKVLFIDMLKRNKREYRISVNIPFDRVVDFYAPSNDGDGRIALCAGDDCRMLSQKSRTWRKTASKAFNVFSLIKERQ